MSNIIQFPTVGKSVRDENKITEDFILDNMLSEVETDMDAIERDVAIVMNGYTRSLNQVNAYLHALDRLNGE